MVAIVFIKQFSLYEIFKICVITNSNIIKHFLATYVRKIAKSDYQLRPCVSVRPSARNNSAPTLLNFMKFVVICRNSVHKTQVSVQYDTNNAYLTWRRMCIYDNISLKSSQNEKCFRQNTHLIVSNFFS
jgi:hypothetical protein